eukprot:Colp12_sorted_trinity150504_noHs@3582
MAFTPTNLTEVPSGYGEAVQLFGREYGVYRHSYLNYGVNAASDRLLAQLAQEQGNTTTVASPCHPQGFTFNWSNPQTGAVRQVAGTSDHADCRTRTRALLDKSYCPYQPPERCTFNGAYAPPLEGRYYAFSAYFYTSSFLNLSSAPPINFIANGAERVCGLNFSMLSAIPYDPQDLLPYMCFQSEYVFTLLTYGYGFEGSSGGVVEFVDTVEGSAVGWALGFMLKESSLIPPYLPTSTRTFHVGGDSVVLLSVGLALVFVGLLVGLFAYARNRHAFVYKMVETGTPRSYQSLNPA